MGSVYPVRPSALAPHLTRCRYGSGRATGWVCAIAVSTAVGCSFSLVDISLNSEPAAGTPIQVEYWYEQYGIRKHGTKTFTGWVYADKWGTEIK
jgi:hypothetical protein